MGLASRPCGFRAIRRQRWREAVRTPRMRATVVGDSPRSTSSTARRRRRSSSADVPLGLMLYYTHVQKRKVSFLPLDSVGRVLDPPDGGSEGGSPGAGSCFTVQ